MESNVTELTDFLDKIEKKGEIPTATAQARKLACQAAIDVISEGEPHTVEWLRDNLDKLMNRVANKNERLSTASANAYRSRIQSALTDFSTWQSNPLGWRPKLRQRNSAEGKKSEGKKGTTGVSGAEQPTGGPQAEGGSNHPGATYIYPLRPDARVEIRNLPHNLKVEEAWRLACFMATLAEDFRPTGGSPFGELVKTPRSN